MGLIKATVGAIGSTLGDQWEDFIKCDSLSNDVLVEKKTTKSGQISSKSRIEVAPGQVAIIYDTGKIIDVTAEAGVYTFDASTSPSFFAGQFGDVLKEAWQRFTYNGAPAKEQAVYYVNIKENIGNKFGTANPMSYEDPEYRNIYIRYFGMYSFKITNPILFFQNVVGNISDVYTKAELMEQANAEFINALDTAVSKCAYDGIKFSRLPSEQLRIAKHMNDALDEEWLQKRGMIIESVAIEKITPDDESRARIQKFDDAAMYSKAEYATGRMVDATANAMEGAANNANGAANGFMGLGMMNMTAGNMMGGQSPLAYVQQNQQSQQMQPPPQASQVSQTPVQEASETKMENGQICPNCGKTVEGKFCGECGTKMPEVSAVVKCPICGADVSGKFCGECGTKVRD